MSETKYPDDMEDIARRCGYSWPDDDEGRLRVLILIAKLEIYWREKCDEALRGLMRERSYRHLQERNVALSKKLKAVRKAASEFKRMQLWTKFEAAFFAPETP